MFEQNRKSLNGLKRFLFGLIDKLLQNIGMTFHIFPHFVLHLSPISDPTHLYLHLIGMAVCILI